MSSFNAEMGRRIRELRERYKYSREKLAEMTDINDKFLYEVEIGNKGISAERLYRLSVALAVSADYLMTGSDNDTKNPYIEALVCRLSKEDQLSIEKILREITVMMHNGQPRLRD